MYCIGKLFQIVKRFDIIDAMAYLLEKSGDVKGAFSLLLQVSLQTYILPICILFRIKE
jgi:hypothetical protein